MNANHTDAIVAEIKSIVSKISRIDESEFEEKVLIREELGIDSLMGMEIIANCEKAFGIRIDESRFASIETVGDFLGMIKQLYERKQTKA
jgi:acyl carrier protein